MNVVGVDWCRISSINSSCRSCFQNEVFFLGMRFHRIPRKQPLPRWTPDPVINEVITLYIPINGLVNYVTGVINLLEGVRVGAHLVHTIYKDSLSQDKDSLLGNFQDLIDLFALLNENPMVGSVDSSPFLGSLGHIFQRRTNANCWFQGG